MENNNNFSQALREAADAYEKANTQVEIRTYEIVMAFLDKLARSLEWGHTRTFAVGRRIEIYAHGPGSGADTRNYCAHYLVVGTEDRAVAIQAGRTEMHQPDDRDINEWLHEMQKPEGFAEFVQRVQRHNSEALRSRSEAAQVIAALEAALHLPTKVLEEAE